MRYATVNNIKLCYEIHGDGYPVILVHGFGSKKETWIAQVCPLSDHFKVIAFDNRGAGKSDRPDGPYTIEMYADDIRGLMDYLSIDKSHVIGWSLGGMIVQTFLLKYPDRANKAVLINTIYKSIGDSGDTNFRDMYVKMRIEELEENKKDPLAAYLKSARASYYYTFRKEMEAEPKKKFFGLWSVEDLAKERLIDPQTPRDLENQASALEGFNTFNRLHEIKNETLLLAASHDKILPNSGMLKMHELIPNSTLQIIEKAGHCSPRSRAPEVNQIIINFLKN
ncbi:MAG: alpha/beta fold hydrolase [Promethearchaeota archaeon]